MNLPNIIYGTAWKKEATTALAIEAVKNGFRAIDTACNHNIMLRKKLVMHSLYCKENLRANIFQITN